MRTPTAIAGGLLALFVVAGCGAPATEPVSLASAPTRTVPTTTTTTPAPTTTATPTPAPAPVQAAAPVAAPVVPRTTTRPPTPRTTTARPPVRTQAPAPAAAQAPAPESARSSSGCDPNYSGCVPIDSDVDCAGGKGNGPSYVKGPVQVTGKDVYGLDADDDGVGCE